MMIDKEHFENLSLYIEHILGSKAMKQIPIVEETKTDKETVTIDDLNWGPHDAMLGGERARIYFENGYGASVIFGGPFYTDGGTYELAVMHRDIGICYDTPVAEGDVLCYLTEEQVNKALIDISRLMPRS